MTDCYGTLSGNLIIRNSIVSEGCAVALSPPALLASITLAGDAIVDGWNLGNSSNIPVIDIGDYNLRLTNIITSLSSNHITSQVVGTGVLTVGREILPSGIIMDFNTSAIYMDDIDQIDFRAFAGVMEVVGVAVIMNDLMPPGVVNIRQSGLLLLLNYFDNMYDVISSNINVYSDLSIGFVGGVDAPNITLHQSTTFLYFDGIASTATTVDLTGINLNGFCIEYGFVEGSNPVWSVANWTDGSAQFIGADMTNCVEKPGGENGGEESGGDDDIEVPNTGLSTFLSGGTMTAIGAIFTASIIAGAVVLKRKLTQ
jgi:hypothetical protein